MDFRRALGHFYCLVARSVGTPEYFGEVAKWCIFSVVGVKKDKLIKVAPSVGLQRILVRWPSGAPFQWWA